MKRARGADLFDGLNTLESDDCFNAMPPFPFTTDPVYAKKQFELQQQHAQMHALAMQQSQDAFAAAAGAPSPAPSSTLSSPSSSTGPSNPVTSFLSKIGRNIAKATASGAEASAPSQRDKRIQPSSSRESLDPASTPRVRANMIGSSSRGAGVRPSRTLTSAIDPSILEEELRREADIATGLVASYGTGNGGGRGGRGGLINQTHGKTKPTVAATTTDGNNFTRSQRASSISSPGRPGSPRAVSSPVSPHSASRSFASLPEVPLPMPTRRKSVDAVHSPSTEHHPEPSLSEEVTGVRPMLRPSQILAELAEVAQHTSDPSRLVPLMRMLAKSVSIYPFPPPALAAAPLSEALASHPTSPTEEELPSTPPHLRRSSPTPNPVQIYLSQSRWLTPQSPPALREAVLSLLVSCIEASQSETGGMKETDKAIYWDEARRWAEEGKVQVENHSTSGGRRWVLPDTDRELLVSVLSIMTRRGRDLSDVPGLVALLCQFVIDALPVPRPSSPLFDLSLQTPFVRKAPSMPESRHVSSLALLTALHRFSAAHIYTASTLLALRAVLEVAKLQDEDDIGGVDSESGFTSSNEGPKDGSVIGFLLALVRYGEVTGGKEAQQRAHLDDGGSIERRNAAESGVKEGDEVLREVVSVVARIIGCEGNVRVVELIEGDVTAPSNQDRGSRPSHLPQRARQLMTELIRSPANQAFKWLRNSLIAPPTMSPKPQPPILLLVGTLRALRQALSDHSEEIEANVERRGSDFNHAKTSFADHRLPSLLSLGLPYLWKGLVKVMDWQSGNVDAEVLRLMEERLESMDRLANKMKEIRETANHLTGAGLLNSSTGASGGGGNQNGGGMSGDEGENGVGYEEWDMAIELLTKAKSHIGVWEMARLRSWMLADDDDNESDDDDASDLSGADDQSQQAHASTSQAHKQPEVLDAFGALFRRVVRAWRSPGFAGSTDRVFTLLISIAPHLPESYAVHVIEKSEAHALCLPSHPDWLDRTQELLKAFYVLPSRGQGGARVVQLGTAAPIRRRALQLLASLHSQLRDLSAFRDALVGTIILPLLETSFEVETDIEVAEGMISMIHEIVRDTVEHEMGSSSDEQEGPLGPFDRLRLLLIRTAKGSVRPFDRYATSAPTTPKMRRANLVSLSRYNKDTSPSALRSSPSISAPVASAPSISGSTNEPLDVAHLAAIGLISMFHVCLERSTHAASEQAITVFRGLLALLCPAATPNSDALTDSVVSIRTRLLILSWLVRLRADASHRIQWISDVDISGPAKTLYRYGQTSGPASEALSGAIDDGVRGRSSRAVGSNGERSTSGSRMRKPSEDRSPSRLGRRNTSGSGPASTTTIASGPALWSVPETLPFEFGAGTRSTGAEALVSFDHNRMRLWTEEEDPGTGQFVAKEVVDLSASATETTMIVLPVSEYLVVINHLLAHDQEWELVSYLLCHLPQQLSNKHFAAGPRASVQIHVLLRQLCGALKQSDRGGQGAWPTVLPMGLKRAEAHAVAYQVLTALIAYRSLFNRAKQHDMVETFMQGLSNPRDTAKPCIHALSIASFEMQVSVTKHLAEIVRSLQRIISSAELGVHILEFIAGVGQQPSLYANFTEVDFHTVFGIALKYIQAHSERTLDAPTTAEDEEGLEYAFRQYVFLLAYYCIAAWFLALRLSERPKYVSFLTKRLVQANEGKAEIDEPTEVCFDMIARYAYTNADPRARSSSFDELLTGESRLSSGLPSALPSKTWIIGTATMTISSLKMPGWVEVTIRRASGVVKMLWELQNITGVKSSSDAELVSMYMRHRESSGVARGTTTGVTTAETNRVIAPLGSPSVSIRNDPIMEVIDSAANASPAPTLESGLLAVDPSFFALQLSQFPELDSKSTPILLPNDPAFIRGVRSLDLVPVVDLHKIGVLYAGPGQTTEAAILGNVHGSKAYVEFISQLGKLWRLKDSPYYCGGLDRENDMDGKWMYVWDDDIAQMFFHVATLMPTDLERYPKSERKKSHIGNDYVKVIFNDSGSDFAFDTLPSEFNFVNIVIQPHTPAGNPWLAPGMTSNAEFFKITMQCRPGMPEIGPLGSFKMVTGSSLPHVVRQLALHSNIFAQIYLATVGFEGGHGRTQRIEYRSNWRQRLQQIKQLKKRILDQRGMASQHESGARLDLDEAEFARSFTSWL